MVHVVGDDHDGVSFHQFEHQLLDAEGGRRVERAAGLVHEDHLGPYRQHACDAEALLLAPGEVERRRSQLVFHLVPERGAAEACLDDLIEFRPPPLPVQPGPVGDVVVDGHGEGVGLLEDHPDLSAQLGEVDPVIVDALPVDKHLSLDPRSFDLVVHAVEAPEEGRFPASGRSDQRGNMPRGNGDRNLLEGRRLPVVHIQHAGFEFDLPLRPHDSIIL